MKFPKSPKIIPFLSRTNYGKCVIYEVDPPPFLLSKSRGPSNSTLEMFKNDNGEMDDYFLPYFVRIE